MSSSIKKHLFYAPVYLSVLFYFLATLLYPGGSAFNKNSIGFNYYHNYWCDMLSEKAINNQANSGRIFAILALFFMCFWMFLFFYDWCFKSIKVKPFKILFTTCIGISMLSAFFLFTEFHDELLLISAAFGFIPFVILLISITKSEFLFHKKLVGVCFLLLTLCYCMYYFNFWESFLPLLQFISLFFALLWTFSFSFQLKNTN